MQEMIIHIFRDYLGPYSNHILCKMCHQRAALPFLNNVRYVCNILNVSNIPSLR